MKKQQSGYFLTNQQLGWIRSLADSLNAERHCILPGHAMHALQSLTARENFLRCWRLLLSVLHSDQRSRLDVVSTSPQSF
jgi:hypothetical protein